MSLIVLSPIVSMSNISSWQKGEAPHSILNMFPIFFLILPSMLVVAAGPGLLQVFKYLFPLMRNYQYRV
jgi:hypothetical protein